MITDQQIDHFFIRHRDTGKEREFSSYEEAKMQRDFRNDDGDHTDYQPWELFAKLK